MNERSKNNNNVAEACFMFTQNTLDFYCKIENINIYIYIHPNCNKE